MRRERRRWPGQVVREPEPTCLGPHRQAREPVGIEIGSDATVPESERGEVARLPRSLAHVRVIVPERVREVLDVAFSPDTKAWDLQPDGSWIQSREASVDLQELLMKRLAARGE